MNKLSNVISKLADKLSGYERENELEYQEYLEYLLDKAYEENDNLKIELKNYKNDYLSTENILLKEKNNKLDNLCSKLTQENSCMEKHIDELDGEVESLIDLNSKSNQDYMDLEKYNKVIEDSNKNLLKKNKIYKDVINVLCEKYSIDHEEVFEIVDTIKNDKNNAIEIQR